MSRFWRWVIWLAGVVVVVGVVGVGFVYSGMYNVSAVPPDGRLVEWVMGTTMDHSVARHAESIQPPRLDDPAMYRLGFQHYREMCVECHGAPGIDIGDTGQGLRPDPPELVESAGDWTPGQLFWITKNGVRMTGMPAWGATHSDDKIWAIVAFTRRLPKLSEDDYRKLDHDLPRLPPD